MQFREFIAAIVPIIEAAGDCPPLRERAAALDQIQKELREFPKYGNSGDEGVSAAADCDGSDQLIFDFEKAQRLLEFLGRTRP